MAADFNLTNQYISQSFQQLMQISGSIPVDGTGSVITTLDVTASNVVSASYAATASFLLGSIASASFATYATTANSASHAVSSNSSLTAISSSHAVASNTSISSSHAVASNTSISASHAVQADSSLTAISSSHAVFSDTSLSASHAVRADGSGTAEDLIITVKNVQASTIAAGVPVYSNGVTGENVNILTASNDSSATMPAIGITQTSINANGNGIVVISGRESNIDTSGLVAGKPVYVGLNGTLTATKPTGTALIQNIGTAAKINASGEIILQGAGRTNDLPNLTTDYVWLGDSNHVPQAVASSSIIPTTANTASYVAAANIDGTVATATSASHAVRSDIADGLATTARINIADITASNASFTSASIGYLRTTTGSATIIGDEYIILNADSPTQRFAGIKVYDSGSGLTGSFEWDSIDDNWIQVETGGTSAGMLTGVSGSKGSEAYPSNNTILKGTGNHTVQDSIITDNGTQVTVAGNVSASAFTGSLLGTASYAENANVDSGSWDGIFTGSASMTGSLTVDGDSLFNFKTAPNFTYKDIITFPSFTKSASPGNGQTFGYNAFRYFNIPVAGTVNNTFMIAQGDDANLTNYYSYLNVGGARTDVFLQASASSAVAAATRQASIAVLDDGDNTYDGNAVARYYGTTMEIGLYNSRDIVMGNGIGGGTGYDTRTINIASENMYLGAAPGLSYDWRDATNTYNGHVTKDIEFWYTGSAIFHQTSSVVSPAIVVSGSVASHVQDLTIASTTASIDCNTGDVFRLTLANATNTHLVATNINPGQVITVKVKNNATAAGTLSFNSEFAFAGATAPTVTATVNAEDIITFQSFDSSKLYGTSVLNLS